MALNFNPTWGNGFPQAAQTAFTRATTTWSGHLNSAVQIDVTAIWGVPLPGTLDAICVPNAIENFLNAPQRDTWYPSALADKLAGQDLQGAAEDMTIFFSQTPTWHTGQGNCPNGQLDLESIALHELGHGLGMVSTYWVERGWPFMGSYGNDAVLTTITDVIRGTNQEAALGFVLPTTLHGHPSIYGLHVQDFGGRALTDPGSHNNLSLGSSLVGSNLCFDVGRSPLFAPNPFIPFTSIDHLNSATSLMRPGIGTGNAEVTRAVDAPVLAIMTALGW